KQKECSEETSDYWSSRAACGPHCDSIDNYEASIRFGKRGRQTPHGHAIGPSFFRSSISVLVVKLPCHRATFGPARAFGPDEKGISIRVRDDKRMLALASARRSYWVRDSHSFGVDAGEVNLLHRFPSGPNAVFSFCQGCAAHYADWDFPR